MSLDIRSVILRAVYRLSPFNPAGDADVKPQAGNNIYVSCLIPTYNRPKDLTRILSSLSEQDLAKDKFEVIVAQDGHSDAVEQICKDFARNVNLAYINTDKPIRLIGKIRNITLEASRGKYLLLLDDDTVIRQKYFLSKLLDIFQGHSADIVEPYGGALDGYLDNYAYLNHFSLGAACCAYTRETMVALRGFMSFLGTYEDIDLGIRALILNKKIYKTKELEYYHPPFYFDSLKKPVMMGYNLAKLRRRYSILFWIACFINGMRFLPLLVLPSFRLRQWGKISLGILIGNIFPFLNEQHPYGGA